MKTTQILYIVLLIGIIAWVLNSTNVLDFSKEGFENLLSSPISEPIIPKGLVPAKTDTEAMPNPSIPNDLPFGPYAQMASVGSFQYQDPAMMPAELNQMKKLNEDLRSFLIFEGVNLANSSDPTVSLPLTQLRADARKLQEEVTVLDKNPGVQAQLTQQSLAEIEGALMFLQRKVRLFETAGIVTGGTEGFRVTGVEKTKAKKKDIEHLQRRTYSAILILSASGTVDPVVQARIKRLQTMHTALTDMLTKLNKGQMEEKDIPVYKEDIREVLPNLSKPTKAIKDVFSQGNGKKLNAIEQQLSGLVGVENAQDVFKNLKERGMFRISMDLGYNVNAPTHNRTAELQKDGSMKGSSGIHPHVVDSKDTKHGTQMELPFDTITPGMDANANASNPLSQVSRFDWEKRTTTICEQVKLRGLDPLDFGCIAPGSLMSPAYSWRGHAKMVCGRLGTTMDPNLPIACGCPPQGWKGWTLSV